MPESACDEEGEPDGPSPTTTRPSPELVESWLGGPDDQPGDSTARTQLFREVLGRFASGVTVVTGLDADTPVGLTCQSFTSVSLRPPLVLFCPARTTQAWPLIRRSGRFCVNILGHDQAMISNRMATRGIDKFAETPWRHSRVTGSPVLDGVLGYVDCSIESVHEAGDHYVVIGRVEDLEVTGDRHPLLFLDGRYARPAQ